MTAVPLAAESYATQLRRYRIMAFVTGTVLITGCLMLIAQDTSHNKAVKDVTELIWLGHGWLYLIYVVVVFSLGLKLRWSPVRMVLVMAAGTIPTMSFTWTPRPGSEFTNYALKANTPPSLPTRK